MKTDNILWIVPIVLLLLGFILYLVVESKGGPNLFQGLFLILLAIAALESVTMWATAVRAERRLAVNNWTADRMREDSSIPTSLGISNGIYYIEMQSRDTGGHYVAVAEKLEIEATNKITRMLVTKNSIGTNKFLVNLGLSPILNKPQGFLEVSMTNGTKLFKQIDPFAP